MYTLEEHMKISSAERRRWGRGAHLRDLDLVQESRAEVLEHNAVGGCEEREDVADEVLLALVELLPVRVVGREVDLLRCGASQMDISAIGTRDGSEGELCYAG